MTTEVLIGARQISDALGELTREIARSVVLVRGSMGSSGSGVIWDRPGLVITNHHVVPGPRAELTVAGGRRLKARVVRRAPALDLGNPMGERNAPSLGILASAADDVLRLSITLRPGNSGGALVNARGQVVGIPHMVTGNGLALAVSTRSVRQFLNGATGEVEQDNLLWI